MNKDKIWKSAFFVGIVPALMEGILIYSVEPTINGWILFQAVLFWFTCGFTIHIIDIGFPRILHGIIFTVFLNLPWYIAESIVKNKPEHFMPLVIASILFGTIIGIISKKLKNKISNEMNVKE